MEQDIRWLQRFRNFKKAFAQLDEAVVLPALSKLEKQGLIKAFEFTYELAWNTLKDLLQDQGYTGIVGSRDTFRLSYQVGLIADGDTWMEMIKSRNATSHTYDEAAADAIIEMIRERYHVAFEKLISTLENRITERLRPDEPPATN